MDNGYRSGAIAGGPGYASEPATPREQRAVETQLTSARNLLEQANSLNLALDELRHRLLGLSDPNAPMRDQKEPAQLVRAELAELGVTLERLHNAMQAMGSKVNDLQRI